MICSACLRDKGPSEAWMCSNCHEMNCEHEEGVCSCGCSKDQTQEVMTATATDDASVKKLIFESQPMAEFMFHPGHIRNAVLETVMFHIGVQSLGLNVAILEKTGVNREEMVVSLMKHLKHVLNFKVQNIMKISAHPHPLSEDSRVTAAKFLDTMLKDVENVLRTTKIG